MRYEDVLVEIGEFGRYQKFQFFLLCLVSVTSSFHSMNMVFVGPTPRHQCTPATDTVTMLEIQNLTIDESKHLIWPHDSDGKVDSCSMFNLSDIDWSTGNISMWSSQNRSKHGCLYGWSYSKEFYKSTIVTEWDLVCEISWMRSMASSIYFAGRLVGALAAGDLSDRFGRLKVFYVSVVIQVASGCIAPFSPGVLFFYAIYFIQGAAQVAVYLSVYVLGVELLGPKYRKITGVSVNYFYTLGQLILTGIAYATRQWKWIEIIISLFPALYFCYYWVLSESIHWLLTHERQEEAKKILMKAAKMNKVKLREGILDNLEVDKESKDKKYSVLDIFRRWKFLLIALNIWFNWLANALVYYGLSLNSSKLAGNPYLNFLLTGLVELPSLTIVMLLIDRMGRRKLFMIFMLLAGVACITTAFIPPRFSVIATTMAMIGKFGVTASYAIIYLMAAEVFPTVVRNVGLGISSMCARVGGILAPQILLIGDYARPLPLIIFGSLAIFGGSIAMLLPELTGKPLAQNFKDAKTNRSSGKRVEPVKEENKEAML